MNIDQGSLKETPAGALLLKIFEEGKSGVLYLKRDEILKELYIDRGKIVWVASNSEVDTLENMLILHKRVEKQNIDQIKMNSKNEIELGKNLVEKGMLTLEELIEFSKVQMRKIVKSILKWGDGVYYFSKDVPANTFINLEIDLKKFVFDFVKVDLDMGFIWKGIGSFQELFLKSEDNKKIEKYDLSQAELELLDKFTGEVNVEVISLNFVGLPKEEILKTIYFYLLAGLLYKKDDYIEEDERLKVPDNLISESKKDPINLDNEISEIEQIDLDDINEEESYSYEKEFKKDIDEKEKTVLDNKDVIEEDISITDKMLQDLNKEETKKKSKIFNIFFILVVIAIIIAGVVLFVLDKGDNIAKNTIINKPVKKSADSKGMDRNPDKKNELSTSKSLIKSVNEENNVKGVKADTGLSLKKSDKPSAIVKNLKKDNSKIDSRTPFDYFNSGRFVKAGNLWRKDLLNSDYKYSVLLELDCQKESVKYAYRKIKNKINFFIINHTRNGKNCYLVLYGRYKTDLDALRSIDFLPKYFLNQKNPPRVLELAKYL